MNITLKKPEKTKWVQANFWLKPEDRAKLKQIVKSLGMNQSEFLRQVIRGVDLESSGVRIK
ncbi:hypothetical protein [Egbenema bharatensis]|uniref:hypothetical protein n=1 Tax=Egbenema bharatensis TaxID=3463334 RepID=UPI003A88ACB1